MRLRVTFAIPFGSRVAYDYPHHLGAMVYTLLGQVAPDLSARLHAKGLWTDQSRPYKLFTFSQLWGGPGTTKATRQGLVFDTEKLQWRFDAAADMVTTLLADALLAAERVRIGSLDAAVREIATEKEPDFAAQPLALTALSPLVASVFSEELATRYADPKDDDFWRILETNLYRKWTAFTGEPPSGPVTFTPDREYLRRNPRTSKRVVFKTGGAIVGHLVPFALSGPTELLRLAYRAGLGGKNALGFGMVAAAKGGKERVAEETENVPPCDC